MSRKYFEAMAGRSAARQRTCSRVDAEGVMTDTVPVSHALIEFRSDRLGEFVVAMQGTGFQLRPLAESSLPARPIKAEYEITDVEQS